MVTLFAIALVLASTGVASAAPSVGKTAEFVPDQILVQFESGANAAEIAKFHRSQGISVVSEIPEIGIQVLKVPSGRILEKVAVYEKNPNVVYAEPNYIVMLQEVYAVPGDPYFEAQWALDNQGQTGGTKNADIDWLDAYNALLGQPMDSVIIAVNDTGIDLDHPDLNLVGGWDMLDDDPDPSDEGLPFDPAYPYYGHGTHVAGIAAAITDNEVGIAGVAFATSIKIMPVRVFDATGVTTMDVIAKGLIYAAEHGADVINMSYGYIPFPFGPSRTERSAIRYAYKKGTVLVAAAGNDSTTLKTYPAAYSEVIAVSATDQNDSLTDYSNYGSWLSVAAPGGDDTNGPYDPTSWILSTYPATEEDNCAWWGGTSMATPHVSGLAALLLSQDPSRSNQEVRSIIEETAYDLGADGFDNMYGYGRINAEAAVTYQVTPPPPPPSELTVSSIEPTTMQAGTTVGVTISGEGFVTGADVSFENGAGPAPTAYDVIVSGDGTSITAQVNARSGGPPRNRVWDIRVTNPDGSSGILLGGFTVTP